MRCNNIAASVAAEIAVTCRLRPRIVQLTPRAFYLLSRSRGLSSTSQRPIRSTAIARAESPVLTASELPSIDKHDDKPGTVPSEGASNTQRDGFSSGDKTTQDQSDASTRRNFFINLMRTVPHPVAVITARKQGVEDDTHGTVAATVSSFNTVSLDPDIVVSFNLKANSITYETIVESRYFTVSFPDLSTAGIELVSSFTKGNDPSPFMRTDPLRPIPQPFHSEDRPSGAPFRPRYLPPAVSQHQPRDSDGSGLAFAFVCEHQTSTPIGDHVIVSGRLSPISVKTAHRWGPAHGGARLSNNIVTLTHAHGAYSNAESAFVFSDPSSLDEAISSSSRVKPSRRKISVCKYRLKMLELAKLLQQGVSMADLAAMETDVPLADVEKLAAMEPHLLEGHERYYMQRLRYWELKAQEAAQVDSPSKSSKNSADFHVRLEPYGQLPGHERLFIRSKMLLSQDELDQELSLYETRLSKVLSQTPEDPMAKAIGIDAESMEEQTLEETEPDPNKTTAQDSVSRNTLLKHHFARRVLLLQHAKLRKAESSGTNEPIGQSKKPGEDTKALKRFLGVQKSESLQGLKVKWRRYQYQITEAQLSLIGLEELPGGHPNVEILRDRIAYFKPRLEIIERCIKDRARSSTAKDLLADAFKAPPMRIPDEGGKMVKIMKAPARRERGADEDSGLKRKLVRPVLMKDIHSPHDAERHLDPPGDSSDQLDTSSEVELTSFEEVNKRKSMERQRQAIEKAAKNLPAGVDASLPRPRLPKISLREQNAADPHQDADGGYYVYSVPLHDSDELSSERQKADEEWTKMSRLDKDLLRRNAEGVRDYLVLQSTEDEGEDMPSPDDFIDVNEIRKARLRKEQEERRKQD